MVQQALSQTGRHWMLLLVLVLLLLVGGVGIFTFFASKKEKQGNDPDLIIPATTPTVSWLPTEEQRKVDAAVSRGVSYLQKCLTGDNTEGHIAASALNLASGNGWPALAGLALLHCGIPASDPAIQKAIGIVRSRAATITNTYELGACILFLDRLGDSRDHALLQTLAVRLLAGQQGDGGWPYVCEPVDAKDQAELLRLLKREGDELADAPEHLKDLPILNAVEKGKFVLKPPVRVTTNSLTLFAMLGLWVARRYDLPVDRSLAFAEARFRRSQLPSGAWDYGAPGNSFQDSMTCAGLLALALGRGVQQGKLTPLTDDPAVRKGLKRAALTLGKPAVRKEPGDGRILNADAWGDLFYLWTLERMAVVYDLRQIEGKDWYSWGVNLLLPTQNEDGSWTEHWPAEVDTCFALLFLGRVNVTQDLTQRLRENR